MAEPIHRGGTWWHEQEDGRWLRWDDAAAMWNEVEGPPPPPSAGDATPERPYELTPRSAEDPGAVEPYRSPANVGRWVVALLIATIALDVVAIVSDLLEFRLLQRIESGDFSSLGELTSEAESNDDRQATIGGLQLVLVVATLIPWLIWFRMAYRNLPSLGVSDLRFKPGWAVGAWFVPFLNLVRPKQIADDIWRGSDPNLAVPAESMWRLKDVHAVLHWWWATLIGSGIAARIGLTMADSDEISELQTSSFFTTLADVLGVVASVLAIQVVKMIIARQEARAEKVRASAPAEV